MCARLDDADVPWGALNDIGQLLQHPQLSERARWRSISLPNGTRTSVPIAPFLQSSRDETLKVPSIGQHTRAVLLGLGMTADEVAGLEDAGVISCYGTE